MFDLWLNVANSPLVLALLIVIGTYILEDAAILSAALLSADGLIPPDLAFYSLFAGIFSGDLGLYALGIVLRKAPTLVNWIGVKRLNQAKCWLEQRMVFSILLVRLVPGLRLPTYTACGFVGLSFRYFIILVLVASVLWTGIVFFGVFSLGNMFWTHLSNWKWLFLPLLLVLIMVCNEKITRYFTRVFNNGS